METRFVLVVAIICALSSHVLADWEEFAKEIQRQGNHTSAERLLQANYLRASKAVGLKNFPCELSLSSRGIPSSVHELGPRDIQVIGALGDSLTAANGAAASWILQVLTEYRGLSWSVGGDKNLEEVTTLPNLLRKYNPNLVGYSIGEGSVEQTKKSHFNVAVPGSTAYKMEGQARNLIHRMKSNPAVDYDNDWKMVTLFVGGNDLCDWVKDKEKFKAESYVANIKAALDLLHKEMPRTFVNLVQIADVAQLASVKGIGCKLLRVYLCPSALFAKSKLLTVMADYREALRELVQSGVYDTKDDFTVVLQPMYEHTVLPRRKDSNKYDTSYFAPDCFHFSGKGHAAAAKALWSNLFEPVGSKTDSFDPGKGVPLKCPSKENPHFYTAKNSQPKVSQLKSANSLQNAFLAAAERDDGVEVQDEDTNSNKSPAPGVATAVGVVGGLMIISCIVIAVVLAVKRRKTRDSEQTWLFEPATTNA